MTPNPTISQIMTSMASFLAAVLPSDVAVVQGQPNRVAAPSASRYVIMSPPRFSRLETNVDTSEDAVFTGSISGTTMTITAVDSRFPDAQLAIGDTVFGPTILPNTVITAGAGQVGTYTVSNSQTVAPGTISAGSTEIQMNAIATIQLDFHASDQTAGDLATVVSATMRDPFAVDQFANQSPNYGTVPIHADVLMAGIGSEHSNEESEARDCVNPLMIIAGPPIADPRVVAPFRSSAGQYATGVRVPV